MANWWEIESKGREEGGGTPPLQGLGGGRSQAGFGGAGWLWKGPMEAPRVEGPLYTPTVLKGGWKPPSWSERVGESPAARWLEGKTDTLKGADGWQLPEGLQKASDWANYYVTGMEGRLEAAFRKPFERDLPEAENWLDRVIRLRQEQVGMVPVKHDPDFESWADYVGRKETEWEAMPEGDIGEAALKAAAIVPTGLAVAGKPLGDLWRAQTKTSGLGRWVEAIGGLGFAGLQEPALAVVGGLGSAYVLGQGEAEGLDVDDWAPLGDVAPSMRWADMKERQEAMDDAAAKGDIERWFEVQREGWFYEKEPGGRAVLEDIERVRAGVPAERVAGERYDIVPQLIAELVLDPLNMMDVLGWGRGAQKLDKLTKAQRLMVDAVGESDEARTLQRVLMESADEGVEVFRAKSAELGLPLAGAGGGPEDAKVWDKLKGAMASPFELTAGARAERDTGELWIVVGGPLNEAKSGDEALGMVRRWVEEPENLARELGGTVQSEAGQKAGVILGEVMEEAGRLPSVGKEPFNSARFVMELEELALGRLRDAYGHKDPGKYMQFVNAWKGLQSEFYLTALFSPGYVARNTAGDSVTMLTDGLATFEKVEDIDRYFGELGEVTTRRLTTGGRGSHEALTGIVEGESRLPGPLGWMSKKGQEIARRGEPLGRLPVGEEPRYKRAMYRASKQFFDEVGVARTPDVGPQVRALLGPQADDLVGAVGRALSPEAKRAAVERVLGAKNAAEGMDLAKYLDIETLDAMSPEMMARMQKRFGELGVEATPEGVGAVFDEVRGWVDEWEQGQYKDVEVVPGRKVAVEAEVQETLEAVVVDLMREAERLGDPGLVRKAQEIGGRLAEMEGRIDDLRRQLLEAAKGLAPGDEGMNDALLVLLEANQDGEKMLGEVRRAMDVVMREAREAYQRAPGMGGEVWPPYFERAAVEWEGLARRRVERYNEAGRQLQRLQAGESLEDIGLRSHRERAEELLRRAGALPEELEVPVDPRTGRGYVPGSVSVEREAGLFDEFLAVQRRRVDVASGGAWRAGFRAPAERYGDVVDLLDSAARDVEFLSKKAAGEVAIARNGMLDEVARLEKERPRNWRATKRAAVQQYIVERNRLWGERTEQVVERWGLAGDDVDGLRGRQVDKGEGVGPEVGGVRGEEAELGEGAERAELVLGGPREREGLRSGTVNPGGTAKVGYRKPLEAGGVFEVDYLDDVGKVLETRTAMDEREAQRLVNLGEREARLRAQAIPSGEQSVVGMHMVPEGAVKAGVTKRGTNWVVEYTDGQGRVLEAYDFERNYGAAKAAKNRANGIIAGRERGIGRQVDKGDRLKPTVQEVKGREDYRRALVDVFKVGDEEADAWLAVTDARAEVWGRATGRDAGEWYGEYMGGAVRGGELGEEALRQADTLKGAGGPMWYGKAEGVVEAKMPVRAPVEQVRGILLKGGIKKDELRWTGILDWLEGRPAGEMLEREEVLGFLRENQVRVEEVVRGATSFSENEALQLSELERRVGGPTFTAEDGAELERLNRRLHYAQADQRVGGKETKFSTYTEPGGEGYRELLITLPDKSISFEDYLEAHRRLWPEDKWVTWDEAERAAFRRTYEEELAEGIVSKQLRSPFYRSSHWDEDNVLVHVRFDERVGEDGGRVLFVEEIQSDWHQTGRKKGYKIGEIPEEWEVRKPAKEEVYKWKTDEFRQRNDLVINNDMESVTDYAVVEEWGTEKEGVFHLWWQDRGLGTFGTLEEAQAEAFRRVGEYDGWGVFDDKGRLQELGYSEERARKAMLEKGVPAAPFAGTWDELGLKRMLRWAAEEGFDEVAWTTGRMQVERYENELRKAVDAIEWERGGDGVRVMGEKAGGRVFDEVVPLEGTGKIAGKEVSLEDLVGKEMAGRMRVEEAGRLEGEALTIGGKGMEGFYDGILPYSMKEVTKRWGGEVGPVRVGDVGEVQGIRITDEMRRDILGEGLPMFQKGPATGAGGAGITKGAVEFGEEGKAILHAFEGSDFSTVAHETGHIFRRDLVKVGHGEDVRVVEEWAGVQGGKWTREAEEKFARGFERYLAEGWAPSAELGDVFERFKEWLLEVYRAIKGSEIDVEMTDGVRGVLDRMLDEGAEVRPGDVWGRERAFQEGMVADEAARMAAGEVPLSLDEAGRMYGGLDNRAMAEEMEREARVYGQRSSVQDLRALADQEAHVGLKGRRRTVEVGGYDVDAKRDRVLTAGEQDRRYWELQGIDPDLPKAERMARGKVFRAEQAELSDWHYSLAEEFRRLDEGDTLKGVGEARGLEAPEGVVKREMEVRGKGGVEVEEAPPQSPPRDAGGREEGRGAGGREEGRAGARRSQERSQEGVSEWALGQAAETVEERRRSVEVLRGRVDQKVGGVSEYQVRKAKKELRLAEERLEGYVKAGKEQGLDTSGAERVLRAEGRRLFNEGMARKGAGEPNRWEMVQASAEATRRGLGQMEQGVLRDWDRWRPVVQDEGMRRAVDGWMEGSVMPRWWETRATGLQYAKNRADEALLNYRSRRNLDMWMAAVAPYSYWYTRSGVNWAKRLAARPGILSSYLRTRDAMRLQNENAGRRSRFEGAVGIPMGGVLPEWMGENLYVDPWRFMIPFAAFEQTDWDDPEDSRVGLRWLFHNAGKYGMRPYHFLEFPFQAGLFERAGEAMGMDEAQAHEWLGPETPGDFGFLLPQTRAIRTGTALARELGVEGLPPGGINIEAPLRSALGLPAGEVWDRYRVGRMLANMAAEEGGGTPPLQARGVLRAQELVKRDEMGVGKVWSGESQLAVQVAAELGWSAAELAEAQRVLGVAMQRTSLEQGVGSVGWAMGPRMLVEPTGERRRIELAEEARGKAWSPGQPFGSYEGYRDFKLENPALYAHGSQYQLVPGEELEQGMGPGSRANWLGLREEKERINGEYDARVDALLRERPGDSEGARALEEERMAALGEAESRLPVEYVERESAELGKEAELGLGGPRGGAGERYWGESPVEYGERVAEDVARGLRGMAPEVELFTGEDGEIDWRGYFGARDGWLAGLDKVQVPGLDAVRGLGGKYAGMGAREVVETYGQRYDSPVEAAVGVYGEVVSGPAWDEYHRLVDGGVEKAEAWDRTVGQVGEMGAEELIGEILERYRGGEGAELGGERAELGLGGPRGGPRWTREELRGELEGMVFPALGEQGDSQEGGVESEFWELMGGVPYGAEVREDRFVAMMLDKESRAGLSEAGMGSAVAALEVWVGDNPEAGRAVEEAGMLRAEGERRWPGVRELESGYFERAKGAERRAYLEEHPELREWWGFKEEWREGHEAYGRYYGGTQGTSRQGEPARASSVGGPAGAGDVVAGAGGEAAAKRAYGEMMEEGERRWPGVKGVESGYFEVAEGAARRAYVGAHPELEAYWEFKREFKAGRPEIEAWYGGGGGTSKEGTSIQGGMGGGAPVATRRPWWEGTERWTGLGKGGSWWDARRANPPAAWGGGPPSIPPARQGGGGMGADEVEARWPGVRELEAMYWEVPEGERRAFLAMYPQLVEYWEWKGVGGPSWGSPKSGQAAVPGAGGEWAAPGVEWGDGGGSPGWEYRDRMYGGPKW